MENLAAGRELLIFLVAAGIVVPLFQFMRLGVVLGFLIAGIAVGPGGFGHLAQTWPIFGYAAITDVTRLQTLGDLGVLFLLFTIGLELSLGRLASIGKMMVQVGGLQVVLATAVIYALAAWAGFQFDDSLVLGMAFALSSTAIVTQSLIERKRLVAPSGRITLGVLILQDLTVVPIVIVVGILGTAGATAGASVGLALVQGIGIAVAVVVAVLALGRFLIKPLMQLAGATGNRTLLIAITLLIIIGAGALTSAAGLSSALGAFLAGLLLSESEYRHQLDVDVEPFKDLLLGLFFMTVGMTIDLDIVVLQWSMVLLALLMMLAVKLVTAYAAARLVRVERPVAIETAFLLAGAGEFAFVMFALAFREKVIDADVAHFATTVAALSMLFTPALGIVGGRIARYLESRRDTANHGVHADEAFSDHVIIGGYGRVGGMVGGLLKAEGIPFVALDLDIVHVERAKKDGLPVFYGDATRVEILTRLGADKAVAFVVTADGGDMAKRMVEAIRARWPNATIHARARSVAHARELLDLGATHVVPEAFEGSLQLSGELLAAIGLPSEVVESRLSGVRAIVEARLSEEGPYPSEPKAPAGPQTQLGDD
ncbi:cation:proton antiporter domain-containing protein [Kaistia sp. MMO-174]|uniref:cation:proton antiporter domain-containing protein n=1 Tax=Kaistia sp. MMO-174 TaxID=3081256 RepID=UPI001AC814BF|nr:cation:proton antiporter [Hyphomicrobiales bacterium]